ncbi:hypothetical protein [Nioella sp.]
MTAAFGGAAAGPGDTMSFGASVPLVIEIALPCEGRADFAGA